MTKLLGVALLLIGLWFLTQDIIITTTQSSPYWYRWLPADISILMIMAGVISILFFGPQLGSLGWILLGIGAVLVFLSGGLLLQGTSMWDFIIAFAAIAGGYQLMTQGRIKM